MLDVEENVALPLTMDGRKPDKERVREMLELMGIENRANHMPSQLSGGQQQRVSIARALFTFPAVILADEPTGNLDSKKQQRYHRIVKTVQ